MPKELGSMVMSMPTVPARWTWSRLSSASMGTTSSVAALGWNQASSMVPLAALASVVRPGSQSQSDSIADGAMPAIRSVSSARSSRPNRVDRSSGPGSVERSPMAESSMATPTASGTRWLRA